MASISSDYLTTELAQLRGDHYFNDDDLYTERCVTIDYCYEISCPPFSPELCSTVLTVLE